MEAGSQAMDAILVIGLAVIALVFGIQKLLKDWRAGNTESDVMKLMHQELQRTSSQNKVLSEELGKLQQQIIQLNTELSRLCVENDKLQQEVVALTSELNAFKKIAAIRKVKVIANAAGQN